MHAGNGDGGAEHHHMVLDHIKTHWPYWNRTQGKDHFFVSPAGHPCCPQPLRHWVPASHQQQANCSANSPPNETPSARILPFAYTRAPALPARSGPPLTVAPATCLMRHSQPSRLCTLGCTPATTRSAGGSSSLAQVRGSRGQQATTTGLCCNSCVGSNPTLLCLAATPPARLPARLAAHPPACLPTACPLPSHRVWLLPPAAGCAGAALRVSRRTIHEQQPEAGAR